MGVGHHKYMLEDHAVLAGEDPVGDDNLFRNTFALKCGVTEEKSRL